jgi:hypothetical protein
MGINDCHGNYIPLRDFNGIRLSLEGFDYQESLILRTKSDNLIGTWFLYEKIFKSCGVLDKYYYTTEAYNEVLGGYSSKTGRYYCWKRPYLHYYAKDIIYSFGVGDRVTFRYQVNIEDILDLCGGRVNGICPLEDSGYFAEECREINCPIINSGEDFIDSEEKAEQVMISFAKRLNLIDTILEENV